MPPARTPSRSWACAHPGSCRSGSMLTCSRGGCWRWCAELGGAPRRNRNAIVNSSGAAATSNSGSADSCRYACATRSILSPSAPPGMRRCRADAAAATAADREMPALAPNRGRRNPATRYPGCPTGRRPKRPVWAAPQVAVACSGPYGSCHQRMLWDRPSYRTGEPAYLAS
jgi:hypothetical protein